MVEEDCVTMVFRDPHGRLSLSDEREKVIVKYSKRGVVGARAKIISSSVTRGCLTMPSSVPV